MREIVKLYIQYAGITEALREIQAGMVDCLTAYPKPSLLTCATISDAAIGIGDALHRLREKEVACDTNKGNATPEGTG
jgi:hypothetical protein